MKQRGHIVLVIALFIGSFALSARQTDCNHSVKDSVSIALEADTLKYASLDKKLDEYCSALRFEPVSVQMQECDFLIDTCTDSLLRQHVASSLYEKYRTSKIMGVESVAIHILDKWFFSGKVSFSNQIELLDARIYADFNRLSLVGNKAQEMTLMTKDGEGVSLFDSNDKTKRFRVLFFYDANCSKCKIETILLRNLLENEAFPVDFYAIYTGSDAKIWNEYVEERFAMSPICASVTHLWDPECESDFQRKYGVLQTPRLYLIAPDNTILGRALDAKTLALMLESTFEVKNLDYGTDASVKLFDSVLGKSDLSVENVKYFADHLAEAALPKGDTVSFRQMSGDLFYYLSTNKSEASREGLDYLIDTYILARSDIWKTPDDSLKIIGMAQMMNELLSKAKPGTKMPELLVSGELSTWKTTRKGKWKLSRLNGKHNIVIFYTDGCADCEAQKKAADEFLALGASKDSTVENDVRRQARKTKVLTINVDELLSSESQIASSLFDKFDLTSLPYIIITDKDGTILRRYVSLL